MRVSLLIFLIAITACNTSTSDKNHDTTVFGNYLQSVFHKEMPDTLTNFIVVPKIGCLGCQTTMLSSLTNGNIQSNCVLIGNIDPSEATGLKYRYLRDSLNIIDRLNIKTQSTTLIRVNNRKVTSIVEVTPDNIDTILKTLSSKQ